MRLAASMLVALALSATAGEVYRDPRQVATFKRHNPCPATGRVRGPCVGWVVDHVTPLCANGPDHPSNMQWQTVDDARLKDRDERRLCRSLRSR